jgi:esterase/lipase superfamily enzyme
MLILSTRRDNSTFMHGPTTWHHADIGNAPIPAADVHESLAGQRVGLFLHGYNVADALGAYAELALRLDGKYDSIIGVTWPGSTLKLGFWPARGRATESGKRIAEALKFMDPSLLDIQGHSLGCRVALEALKHGLTCRNLILAAPAVGDDSLAREYHEASKNAARVVVAHSEHDQVLRKAYRFAMFDDALGLRGPRQPELVAPHVEAWDLSFEVRSHSDYKRSGAYIRCWRSIA